MLSDNVGKKKIKHLVDDNSLLQCDCFNSTIRFYVSSSEIFLEAVVYLSQGAFSLQ